MRPKKHNATSQLDMFRNLLENILNRNHELYRLAALIDWALLEQEFGALYSENGRPGIPIRMKAWLSYLSHAFNTSDEETLCGAGWKTPTISIFVEKSIFAMNCPLIRLL